MFEEGLLQHLRNLGEIQCDLETQENRPVWNEVVRTLSPGASSALRGILYLAEPAYTKLFYY